MGIVSIDVLREAKSPVLVTGHTGFKGAWLLHLLKELQIPVVGLSLEPKNDSLFVRSNLAGRQTEVFGDIRDAALVKDVFNQYKPSAVIHLAAQALVLESYETPVETFEVNVMGTVNVLNAATNCDSVKVVGIATTDKVYENLETSRRFIETDPLKGKDPYSASKVGTEAAVSAWQQISKIKGGPSILSLRAGNVIGGGDYSENRLVPDLVRSIEADTVLHVRSPKSTRPWQHALDPVYGYLMAISSAYESSKYESYNFGPIDSSLPVRDVVEGFKKVFPEVRVKFGSTEEIPTALESTNLDLNSEKAQEQLGWTPRWNQTESISYTASWWQSYLENQMSAQELCSNEIKKFLQRE